ncbi:MAG: hypothetical protein H6P96_1346, partial [Candidatus Aminicenantes bacterium]|nr:hypothetical protein [Candidatus Aminicenantes bacterium]
TALLMASYPKGRPRNPFPYFTEVMTGFEYTAAAGLIYEGDVASGLEVIRNVRARYDGRKRSPFDEAECGHHYARAMASWAAVPALSGFAWDGVAKAMSFNPVVAAAAKERSYFWSNGDAWGICRIGAGAKTAELAVLHGSLSLGSFRLGAAPARNLKRPEILEAGGTIKLEF